MKPAFNQIEEKIRAALNAAVSSIADADNSVAIAVVGRQTSTHLCLNSSFLYRDRSLKTTQSPRRILAHLAATGKRVRSENIWIIDDEGITKHYKIIPAPNADRLMPLAEAVVQEIASIGDLLFTLLGTAKGIRPQVQKVDCRWVRELRLDPSLSTAHVQRTADGVYSMREIRPVEEIFECVSAAHEGQELAVDDRQAIVAVYETMLDQATTEVSVPSGEVRDRNQTILGRITTSLHEQTHQYRAALKMLQDDSENAHALNEVLRIAYNFSADVLPLISLFVSICDLKPLVFWCTVKEQWALHQAFGSLPWAALGRKEKLEEYKSIVSQARSHAFHHVLPFDSNVEIDLSTLDVRAERIRLFLPFGQKHGRGVHLKDHKLADVLAEFSRAKERPVSHTFWKANLAVMQAACNLSEEVLSTLILIHEARREGPRHRSI